ncbi:His-Xaa-Ser system radical SAM maturase HxsC [Pseudovibrio flavus]|uniref:His-Xaa-Ser system radical SAM maturase HxsC n=1 Tax=Pseudovibrio flavus TaxID=2529854 RepID=UPI00211C6E2C|nr:His-Xaa-Ser system radical SAM maturase HxsC [Pseudovibrio flavus]
MIDPLPLRLKANRSTLKNRTIAKITRIHQQKERRSDYFYITNNPNEKDIDNYSAVISYDYNDKIEADQNIVFFDADVIQQITDGTIVAINPDGRMHLLFRPESPHNTLFTTNSCNNNCLMCSQPPHDDNIEEMAKEQMKILDLIDNPPELLGLTGGEPTLLDGWLIDILSRINDQLPSSQIHMLTNGRRYADSEYCTKIAKIGNPNFLSLIPLFADNSVDHDYVVQSNGAFDETIRGIYNAAAMGLRIEVRVVLHKQTIPRLPELMEFIYRNLPFVEHVALMGLENMGYVKKNWETLWIDPIDYHEPLTEAVKHLFYRGIPVSIYNLQMCVVPEQLRSFMRNSISDYKNIYLTECSQCTLRSLCGGLFASSEKLHSRGIKAQKNHSVREFTT